ncbi:MAG: hypothetical protein ACI8RE_000287 [Ilumatobacter sp.]|jgi:hypothetical protein
MSKNSSRNAASWLITSRSTAGFNTPTVTRRRGTAMPTQCRGHRWFVDETSAKVASIWQYVSPGVDQHGQVIDVYVSKRRDIASATTFLTTMLKAHSRPQDVTTNPTNHAPRSTNTTVPPSAASPSDAIRAHNLSASQQERCVGVWVILAALGGCRGRCMSAVGERPRREVAR